MSLIILMIPIVGTITGMTLWLDISLNRYRSKFLEFSSKTEDKSKIRERLEELGNQRADAYGEFRFNQLLISISVALIPIVAAALLIINFATALGLGIFLGILNYLLYDHYLDSKVKRHREIIEAEFPAILEMLTLAIAAGEPPISAFSRVSERSSSLLSEEFRKVASESKVSEDRMSALYDDMGHILGRYFEIADVSEEQMAERLGLQENKKSKKK